MVDGRDNNRNRVRFMGVDAASEIASEYAHEHGHQNAKVQIAKPDRRRHADFFYAFRIVDESAEKVEEKLFDIIVDPVSGEVFRVDQRL